VFAGDAFLGASDVHYNASQHEILHVLLEDQVVSALRPEHEVLISALDSEFKGKLGDLKETDEQQDITFLANKTGWDARAVALAALADQFSARTMDTTTGTPDIPQAFFYALFRAGLPANEDTLYHIDAGTLEAVWKQAAEQGVIPTASADQISKLVERFQTLSAQKLLTGPALVGVSSLKEMLTVSGLNDKDQQEDFAKLYAEHRADMPKFWEAVSGAFDPAIVKRLQVDGKLGFLTINNASLMQKVQATAGANGLSDLLQLAQMGYHRAEPWSQLLTADVPIPKEIPGDRQETRRANYANYLAAQVRLSYPTAAIAQMVKSGALPLTGAADGVSDQVHAFLTEHQGKFEIGVQPVQQYIAQNNVQVDNKTVQTVQQVKRLQRVYQITPSDQALTGLMKRGVDAAYHVVRYDKDTFVQNFAADVGGTDNAALTYDRSVQIHNAVLNIALSYLNARTVPPIGLNGPLSILNPTPANAGDVIAYATLESLFDSMDFCACDHCRSILSPAAYLVDLLLFLHADEQEWKDFCKNWRSKHGGAPYPFPNQAAFNAANQPQDTEISPLNVLLSRRPDIEHLPLTCENTNTALPYIDVVNETLEYFVANAAANAAQNPPKPPLDGYVGHDSNGIASEDLLASPQFVINSAYTTLRGECFPTPLPLHQPLESLRRYFNKFEVPLPLAMERLRKSDVLDVDRTTNPPPPLTDYGWRDILMEGIGLSRDEYEILTDSNTVLLWRMFGFPNGTADADVIAGLSNAKQFARRVGITYEDLVSVLETRFINLNSELIPKLERLGVSLATLKALKDGTITDPVFDKLLAALAVPPDPTEYGGDIKTWVKDNDNYARIMGLITLAIPAGIWAASKVYTIGDCVRPTAAQSQSTLYYECTTSGTSVASEPKWPTTPGNTCSDGPVVWVCRDASSCHSFDNLAFRYSDPAKLTQNINSVEFVRLLRFIRLWKKLGWTIEQTDATICALYRADLASLDATDINNSTKLDTGFLTLLPRLGIVTRVMKALNLTVKRDLLPLLACWSELRTQGDTSLYRQMFLNPAILKQDAVFADNGYGEFLQYVEVAYTHTQTTLEPPIVNAASGKIGYNDSTKRLSYSVIMDAATRSALKAVTGVSQQFKDAIDSLYNAQRLVTHAEALRSALNLTGDEYDQIVAALGYDADTALTIPNLSAIFRWGWLARKLKLSVRELLLLTQLTSLDPFATPNPTHPAILRLIELVQSMKDRSFKSTSALYLVWNQDLSGKSTPDAAQIATFARTLRLGLASIETEFAVADDPDGTIARARMALVYGEDATNLFFGFLDNTFVTDVQYNRAAIDFVTQVTYIHNHTTLEQEILNAAPKQIAYDDATKTLSFTGILTDAIRDALKKIAGVTDDFKHAVDALYAENQRVIQANLEQPIVDSVPGRIYYDDFRKRLYFSGILTDKILDTLMNVQVNGAPLSQKFKDALHNLSQENKKVVVPFFARYPELQPLYDAYVSDTTHSVADKRTNLLKAILPELVQRRKRQQALQSVSAVANTDLAFTQTFLDPPAAPFPLHVASDANQPALDDLLALEKQGLSVQFFGNDTATGSIIPSPDIASKLDYAPLASAVGNPLPVNPTIPGAAISGVWYGYLEAPESGFFNLRIEADTAAKVTLRLLDDKGRPVMLTQDPSDATLWRNMGPIELRAGTLYPVRLTVEKVRNVVRVQWDWEPKGQGRAALQERSLYPATLFDRFQETYVRFLKAASLAMGLGLTANELAYFATHADYRINTQGQIDSNGQGWLNALPNADNHHLTNPADAAVAKNLNAALLTPLRTLLDFARIKSDISPSDESLLAVLKDPTTAMQNTDSLLFTITRWNQTSLNEVLVQFSSNIAGLGHFDLFRRVYDAFALIEKMGILAKALIQATTNDPTSNMVRDLQAALRARYDAADWRDVVRPINDEMRSLQRDALVAYILHKMRSNPDSEHIDTAEKLFEYFLMDVEMDPCMQTSRIRHALSSVQLFIERCLMNLEPRVSPAAINAKQWEWMKRYRVWEANRKVYLFPENWLEPELRDDKSPFFKEIESELLQSDITEDTAAAALLNYLSKLEEVAKLESCGIYHIPADSSKRTGEIDHIVARTAGAHRKYYYRRYEYSYWTPWEQIKLDIEDNPVIPVVWKDRLFLFWLRILKPASLATPDLTDANGNRPTSATSIDPSQVIKKNPVTVDVQAVLCWSEYYNGKWQPTKTSDVNQQLNIGNFAAAGDKTFNRAALMLRSSVNVPDELLIHVGYPGHDWKYFVLYNTHSLPVPMQWNLDRLGSKDFKKIIESQIQKILGAGTPSAVISDELDKSLTQIIMQIHAGIRVSTLQEIQAEISSNILGRLIPGYGQAVGHQYVGLITPILGDILSSLLSPQLLRYRDIDFKTEAVSVGNYDPSIRAQPILRTILTNPPSGRTIEPRHPLPDPWDAPFFYEDSRHLFYVRVKNETPWVRDYPKFAILMDLDSTPVRATIPPLVLQMEPKAKSRPKPWDDGAPIVAKPGVVDTAPMELFVTEDVYIHQGIGTTTVVTFGDKQIGPSGAIHNGRDMK